MLIVRHSTKTFLNIQAGIEFLHRPFKAFDPLCEFIDIKQEEANPRIGGSYKEQRCLIVLHAPLLFLHALFRTTNVPKDVAPEQAPCAHIRNSHPRRHGHSCFKRLERAVKELNPGLDI